MNQILCCDWLPEWARWSRGPSTDDGAILPAREDPLHPDKKITPKARQ